ncbi:uncharacterized protein LOC113495981 [Trichoplusia ni]|uniref:Uncharacterized protein LOC113495981 n=1 Tax=Trichoplusia ni TaxID=7111 RepID=A0A7E5VRN2_TRINI|nr:uncharacterized protein LOC113495981 [Trichoplusia ni]
MRITVRFLVFCGVALAHVAADSEDPTQIEKYDKKIKTYQLDVPGKDPITIIENTSNAKNLEDKWEDMTFKHSDKDDIEIKNLMTHIVHDFDGNRPRCYGPSCQDGYNNEEEEALDEDILTADKLKDYGDFPRDRLQAITALAAKLKKDKLKADRLSSMNSEANDDENNGKVYTTWNRLKVKQHKHPYDDKDGWVSLEPVAWSTSKISKWKPNVKKQKPNHWNDDDDRFPSDDRFHSDDRYYNDDRYQSDERPNSYDRFPTQEPNNNYNYKPQKKPTTRPGYINNKLHMASEYESEVPSKPTWAKPGHQASYPLTWAPDEGRRPHKPNCDNNQETYADDDAVYYGMSDSVVTDHRPPNFPYEYEALHQSASSMQKRPYRRPTQVVYSGGSDYDNDRISRPPHGDGQWVLLSTTKGYRNKKRQRSLNPPADDRSDVSTMTSHQAVALTVLPVDKAHTNMTTSHGGMLEVEKSFQTVEEAKRDMDKKHDLDVAMTQFRPVVNKHRLLKRKIVSNVAPDSSTLLAAVGAGMVPATMAMVVPMMLGRRKREIRTPELQLENLLYEYRR